MKEREARRLEDLAAAQRLEEERAKAAAAMAAAAEDDRRKKEREGRKLEDLAAEQRLNEERTKAEVAASTAAAAEATTAPNEGETGPNKRTRGVEPVQPAIDMTEDDASTEGDTNAHINDINMTELSDDEEKPEGRGPERSPKKKKKRKDKKRKDKSKEKEKEQPSILKPGRFSPAAKEKDKVNFEDGKQSVGEKRKIELEKHSHVHPRVVLVCSVVCRQEGTEAKMNEFVMAARALYKNMVKVDKVVVLESVMAEGEKMWDPQGIPADFTDCGAWLKVSGDAGVFEMRKPRRGDNTRKVDDDELVDPEVYFQCCISCDMEPELILERVSFEWARLGGNRLTVKELSSFATKAAVCLYNVRNDPNHSAMIPELRKLLEEARERGFDEIEDFTGLKDPPTFTLSVQTPKVVGQNTQQFSGWDWRMQNLRKTLHVVVKADEVEYLQELFTIAKDMEILKKYFGPNAKVVMVYDGQRGKRGEPKADLSKYDMAAVASYVRKHINYQANSRYDGIKGILNVDKEFSVTAVTDSTRVVARVSLRAILYKQFKTLDGLPLFCEVHQGEPLGPVDVVVGSYEQAEHMMLMMNKNSTAYCYYYLTTVANMDPEFTARVIRGCFDPVLVQVIVECKWDAETRVLTTPQDEENERLAAMESAAWYKDAFGGNVFDMSKKEKAKQLSAMEMEDLHAEHSVKTAGKKPGRYEGSPGVETFVVGQKKGGQSSGANSSESDEDLGKCTKEELLEMLRAAKITSQGKGSQPRAKKAGGAGKDADGDSSMSGSYTSSGSSNSSVSSSSSVGDKSSPASSAKGE